MTRLTIKTKILALVCFMMVVTICVGVFGLFAINKSNEVNSTAIVLVKDSDELIDTARSAQVHFKIQVQEWKNILLRGQDADNFQKYLDGFNKEEMAVQKDLTKLKSLMDKQGIDSSKIDDIIKIHEDLGKKYRQALANYDGTKADSHLVVDKLVKGIDRAPTDAMDGLVKQIQEAIVAKTLDMERSKAEEYKTVQKEMIFFLITVTCISLLLAVIFINQILKPLDKLKNKLADLVENGGDLTQKIDINSKDEIGQLADSVNKFIDNLRAIMLGIHKGALVVTETAGQLNSSSQQTTATATTTASTMTQVAASVDQITTSIQEVSTKSQETTNLAGVGSEGIGQLTGQMQLISSTSQAIADVITRLSNKSQEINHIVEIINNIAEQTNLLALNAAIEAARAGEQGRGFAVVAEEVRKLAEQSADSAQEIKGLINDIQQESEKAVTTMSEGVKQADSGNLVVQDVGHKFREIISAIQGLTGQIEEVAFTIEQIMAGVQNVAATTEEQTAAMEEVAASAEALAKISENLNAMVDKFKL